MLTLKDLQQNGWESGINQVVMADCLEAMKLIPDKSIDLILTDPPYFEVKGAFDFIWDSFEDYLKFVEACAIEFKRILKDNGSLFWFGHSKKIAYAQIIFDRYFNLENNLVWKKEVLYGQTGSEQIRSFAPCTERILFYSNEQITNNGVTTFPCREYIRGEIIKAKGEIVFKDINNVLGTADNGGGVASATLSLAKAEPAMITKEHYEKLRRWLGEGYLRREYEDLRREYKNLGYSEVLEFSNEMSKGGVKRVGHETQKPQSIINVLIETTTRGNALVLDPFMGSWTTARACKDLGRDFIGFELEEDYCKVGEERLRQQNLF